MLEIRHTYGGQTDLLVILLNSYALSLQKAQNRKHDFQMLEKVC